MTKPKAPPAYVPHVPRRPSLGRLGKPQSAFPAESAKASK